MATAAMVKAGVLKCIVMMICDPCGLQVLGISDFEKPNRWRKEADREMAIYAGQLEPLVSVNFVLMIAALPELNLGYNFVVTARRNAPITIKELDHQPRGSSVQILVLRHITLATVHLGGKSHSSGDLQFPRSRLAWHDLSRSPSMANFLGNSCHHGCMAPWSIKLSIKLSRGRLSSLPSSRRSSSKLSENTPELVLFGLLIAELRRISICPLYRHNACTMHGNIESQNISSLRSVSKADDYRVTSEMVNLVKGRRYKLLLTISNDRTVKQRVHGACDLDRDSRRRKDSGEKLELSDERVLL
ncbi:uncharacterized protein CC84DRAFT_1174068 [Paraphaeosphaeria sporulosa]|uniref:Uncharacterized protein n=1 Tax=Paraphaeosphaeria sporulosa TaxID=1460663 RepID=A0A177CM33_9PLEO|nr:uncharacterized protein CC84DRAFT_1174068 [Paraphaeosphaeria sporulosa]OAG08614.1 hypothetical protein CC84DRAFT_1174068 [Paraphaeosphaeria sporulosa]